MATSLAAQLKRLAVPETEVYKDEPKKVSLLFDPKEAALKDRDTFYEIGRSGLNELIALNETFSVYADTLFNATSKDFQRAIENQEVNKNIDRTIERFLYQLSPYLLLQPAHKALEWLINRYQIHMYNQDAIVALILPYHNTNIFVRIVQLLDIKDKKSKWEVFLKVQKTGHPLSNQALYNLCSSNNAIMHFIANRTIKYVNLFGERANQLNTVFAFFCQTAIGTINNVKKVDEALVTSLLPPLITAISSPIVDFRAAAYIILGYLFVRTDFKPQSLNDIVGRLLTTEFDLTYDVTLLITILYNNQRHYTEISTTILNDLSIDTMTTITEHLKILIEKNTNIYPFVLAFFQSVLEILQSDYEEFIRFSKLPQLIVEQLDFKNQNVKEIIRCVLQNYNPTLSQPSTNGKNSTKDDGSDLEIIEEKDEFIKKVFNWYSAFVKTFERQYPDAFDSVIKEIMGSNNKKNKKQRKYLSKLLGFKPAVAHKVGDAYLFENINHASHNIRIEAVKYVETEHQNIRREDPDFFKESMVNRLLDDHPAVVFVALDLPENVLEEILNEAEVTNILTKLLSRKEDAWRATIKKGFLKLCNLNVTPVNQDILLAIMPYLFSKDKKGTNMTWMILKSVWASKVNLSVGDLGLIDSHKDRHDTINKAVFNALFVEKKLDFSQYLDENLLNKNSSTDICFYLLLKSISFDKATVEEITSTLNLLMASFKTRYISLSEEHENFNSDMITEFIENSREDIISFEFMEYLFAEIIEQVNITKIPKPWVNVCKSPEMILVRKLYEICVTGCSIPSYSKKYAKLLKQLMDKFFKTPKEKFEFVANFACGHILYAADPEDVIGPELQLRSIKLLSNLLSVLDDCSWIYASDVVILMVLFNLNNPAETIRHTMLDFVSKILEKEPDNKLVYIRLMQELIDHKQELILDHNQVSQVLTNIFTQKDPLTKVFRRNCFAKLTEILNSEIPFHIKSRFVKLLAGLNNSSTFPNMVTALKVLEKVIKIDSNEKLTFDIYESTLMRTVYSFINETTVGTLENDCVWNSIEIGLKEYRECVLEEDQTYTSPAVLIMRQFDEDIFNKVPNEKRKSLFSLFSKAGVLSNNPAITSTASKTMKKIFLTFADFKFIFDAMLNAVDPANSLPKKKKSTVSMLSYQLAETEEWQLGVAVLEYVQSKKKMALDTTFVSTLFNLLNKCLRFEEQSYVEYTKQLILSSLWYYCNKFTNENDKDNNINSLKSAFKVELIIQCIRSTQNPQTHHHALLLLTQAAYMLPEQVLHHIMEIFTFMGSSVLRHDDAYSFQIITRIIETLIPILVKMEKNVKHLSEKELEELHKRAVPVLRIFADVVLHVPEHRRLPLYKKLIDTLNASRFLWVLIALLLEAHVSHFSENKKIDKRQSRTLSEQEAPINRLDFGQSILLEFPPEIWLDCFVKLVLHVKSLPLQKDENEMDTDVDPSDIFSVNGHTANQLRHYKYAIITFMNTCLSSSRFIHHNSLATNMEQNEANYKTLIINILTYIQSISKVTDEKTAKYWRVMLHHSYDLLDHTNNLLSAPMFLSVIRGLLKHNLQTVRRKSMELLNSKIQHAPEFLANVDRELILSLLQPLLDIVRTIENKDETLNETAAQELELNQQTALFSLKLLSRMLAAENPESFKLVLETVTAYTCDSNISGNVMASVVLCLAELCGNLRAHSLASLRKFMPALIKVFKKQRKAETVELVLLSTVTAIAKIVESLPLFLSPYLQKILYEYSILLGKWQNSEQEQVSVVVSKLGNIKKKIAGAIPPRVLIPVVNETHQMLLSKENYDAIGPVMSVLAESFTNVTTADFTALQADLTEFFLSALQLRSDAAEKQISEVIIDNAEDEIVNALVSLVLKLSETSFRPFYFKIYDWAIRSNVEGKKDRAITFYRLSGAIADKLKGLFVLFAGHFIKNAADLLDGCNRSKTEDLYFDSEEKCINLIKYIIKTLHIVFLYDSQSFLNKDRFETLMQPIVDQLENTLGGISDLKSRAVEYIIPCVSQFAVATADDSLWKLLNYQILLKTRHNDADVRLIALDCLVAMATQLGSSWLPLLAESVPFLAELLEDGDQKIENSTKDAIRKLEQILGEPLEKYF